MKSAWCATGALIDEARHLARLKTSLAALRIAAPVGEAALQRILREVVARNRVATGWSTCRSRAASRGATTAFRRRAPRQGLVVTAKSLDPRLGEAHAERGVAVITLPDERWAHPHVKSLQLLPNVLAKQAARDAGAYRGVVRRRDGLVTEGASTNAWIVAADGAWRPARPISDPARRHALDLARRRGGRGAALRRAAVQPRRGYGAREAFFSSATTIAMPVVAIDGRPIGDGRPGPLTLALRRKFAACAARS